MIQHRFSHQNTPILTLVIPSLNTRGHLLRMMRSLEAQEGALDLEVIVVDLGSTDGTIEMLRQRFPGVRVIDGVPNRGYGAAANVGLAQATSDYVVVCNSDLVFTEGSVRGIMDRLQESPQDAILGFRLEGFDRKPQRSAHGLPGPLALVWMFAAPLRYWPQLNSRLMGYIDESRVSDATPVGWVTGAALAARRSFFETMGGFDETFFMNSEEVDLCKRVWDRGGRVLYVPEVRLLHVGGGSSGGGDSSLLWLVQAKVRYTRKHFGSAALLVARVGASVAYMCSVPVWLARLLAGRAGLGETTRETVRFTKALREGWCE